MSINVKDFLTEAENLELDLEDKVNNSLRLEARFVHGDVKDYVIEVSLADSKEKFYIDKELKKRLLAYFQYVDLE